MTSDSEPSSSSQNSVAHQSLLHILAAAFFGTLIGFSLSRRNTPYSESIDSYHAQDKTNDDRECRQHIPPPSTRIIVESLPPSSAITPEWRSEKDKDHRLQWASIIVNFFMFLAVVWYACVATQQRDAMIKANEFTQRVFQADIGDFGVANISRQDVGWSIKNSGKTTAENVTWSAKLTVTSLIDGSIVQSASLSSPPFNIKDGDPPYIFQFPLTSNVGRDFESESFKIDVSVRYGNGFGKEVLQSFCREIIGKKSTTASLDFSVYECFEAAPYREKRIKELRTKNP